MTARALFEMDFTGREDLSPFCIILNLKGFEIDTLRALELTQDQSNEENHDDTDISELLFYQIAEQFGLDERHFIVFRIGRHRHQYIVKCRSGEAYTMIKIAYAGL